MTMAGALNRCSERAVDSFRAGPRAGASIYHAEREQFCRIAGVSKCRLRAGAQPFCTSARWWPRERVLGPEHPETLLACTTWLHCLHNIEVTTIRRSPYSNKHWNPVCGLWELSIPTPS